MYNRAKRFDVPGHNPLEHTDIMERATKSASNELGEVKRLEQELSEVCKPLREKIQAAKIAAMQKILAFLTKQGYVSQNLADLKTETGAAFSVVQGTTGYTQATAPGLFEKAYLCKPTDPEALHKGCGWVKGVPHGKGYDAIGPLAGSAGTKYICFLCGSEIAEQAIVHS